MTLTRIFSAAIAATLLATTSVFAADIMIDDPYVRSSTPNSKTGAAFMTLMNHSDHDDRLIGARSDAAARVGLHTHIEDANGVMKMNEIVAGIPIAAGETHAMERGGDHVMLMGLTGPLEQGLEITVTLTFEKAGDVEVQIPVDHARKPDHGTLSH
jgi:copper(I)-binding protein